MIHRLDATDLQLVDAPHPFLLERQGAIAAFWAQKSEANPRLWNGAAVLFADARLEGGVLRATGYRADFATFLYWRDVERDASVVHITGSSLPVTADGALMAVRMSAHTANPGQSYFPGGSFDLEADFIDGGFDVTTNMAREMTEETGIDPRLHRLDQGLIADHADGAWHVAHRAFLSLDAAACETALSAHQQATGDDEVAGAVIVRSLDEAGLLKPYSRRLAEWHFRESADGA